MIEDKITDAIVDVGKNVAEDLVRPTSKSIGDNLGLLVDGVMGWLGYWGEKQAIKRDIYLADYKKRISDKVLNIPEEKLQEPEIRIVGPAIEASKFYIEEEKFREMFAELVASACNTDTSNMVHPAFPEMIKQLSYMDVRLLQAFKYHNTYACCELYAEHQDKTITPYPYILFNFKDCPQRFTQLDELKLTESIENLMRLGLLIKNSQVIELGYDYGKFRTHWFYNAVIQTVPAESQMNIKKYRIELTQLGEDFLKCCFGSSIR